MKFPIERLISSVGRLDVVVGDRKIAQGTAFFVDRFRILTCRHVISELTADRAAALRFFFGGEFFAAQPDESVDFSRAAPDLVLLTVSGLQQHPIAELDWGPEPKVGDDAFAYGFPMYSDIDGDVAESMYFNVEGPAVFWPKSGGAAERRIALRAGLVKPGVSGSPVMSLTTGRVFGVIQWTRDCTSALGGHAIPSAPALQLLGGGTLDPLPTPHLIVDDYASALRAEGDKRYSDACAILEQLSEIGHADALNRLAYYIERGRAHYRADACRAGDLYRKAAGLGSAAGQYNYALYL